MIIKYHRGLAQNGQFAIFVMLKNNNSLFAVSSLSFIDKQNLYANG